MSSTGYTLKYYLSSYKFGNGRAELRSLMPRNRLIGHINNARDFTGADPQRKAAHQLEEMEQLAALGFSAEALDLQDYFHRKDALRTKLATLGGVWVSGGNTFVLRQAMRLSGFDGLLKEAAKRDDFLYAGYSAGICVLSSSLRSLFIVDNPYDYPYADLRQTIWEGLGFFDYDFMPHYDSAHPESDDIDKTIRYCIDHKILFKALRDGEYIAIT